MSKPGEKGKCVTCRHLYMGDEKMYASCLFKNSRHICNVDRSNEEPGLRHRQLKQIYEGKLILILKNKINPYWCPLRQEEF